jgi:hypothetical protein
LAHLSARDNPRHHQSVGDAQAQKSVDAQLCVNNSEWIDPDLAGPYRMSETP